MKLYVRGSAYAWELCYGRFAGYFDAFIISIIILAGAQVGIQVSLLQRRYFFADFSTPQRMSGTRQSNAIRHQGLCSWCWS